MRVAIVESQPHVRAALAYFLQQQPTVEVVGTFGAGPDLVARLLALCPEVVLLDWELPRSQASRVLNATRRMAAPPAVVVLSVGPEAEAEALAAGGSAFIFKGDGPAMVLRALKPPAAHPG